MARWAEELLQSGLRFRPIHRAAVAGSSMTPTLNPGDWIVVSGLATVRPGRIVVARRPDRHGLRIVKRAVHQTPGGWWLAGDNPAASDDSRLFGAVAGHYIEGVVVARYWPSPRVLISRCGDQLG